jgi:hypothetical protein
VPLTLAVLLTMRQGVRERGAPTDFWKSRQINEGDLRMSNGYDAIKLEVEQNGNVLTTTMGRLRDAHGAGRLGDHVRVDISKALAGIGLGHVPVALPQYQENNVRVYKLGTPVADVIQAVVVPAPENDEKLRSLADQDSSRYADVIERIRDLVAQ